MAHKGSKNAMSLSSMTGFSRTSGDIDGHKWTWELRSFNGRGLDVKCRLPGGYEEIEAHVRERVAKSISRGSLQVGLQVRSDSRTQEVTVNHQVLEQVTGLIEDLSARLETAPPSAAELLALRGVLEMTERSESDEEAQRRMNAVTTGFDDALRALIEARQSEGKEIEKVLRSSLDEISKLSQAATTHARAQKDLIRDRLQSQIGDLLEMSPALPEDRLAQEVAVLATKADVSEELDRLTAHMTAASALLDQDGPVGRRLDFLMQEFNRETNTLCSKSTHVDLTNVGLELKAVIDRVREQVQNIE